MIRKFITLFCFFVIVLTPVFSEKIIISQQGSAGAAVQINKDPRYPVNAQMEERFGWGMSFYVLPFLSIDPSLSAVFVQPSNVNDGVQYRGGLFFSPELALTGRILPQALQRGMSLAFGVSAGVQPNYGEYTGIDRTFFYLGIKSELFCDLGPLPPARWNLRFALPLYIYLRKDMQYSLAPGIRISFVHKLLVGKQKEGDPREKSR